MIARERRWAPFVAVTTLLGVVLLLVANATSQVSGEGAAEILRSTDQHHGSIVLGGILQAIAFVCLTAPLFYLFRAVRARSERVRPQLIGLVLAAPLFLAVSAALTIGARTEAAEQFVAGEAKSTLSAKQAKEKCESDRKSEGAKQFAEENEPRKGETPLAACERRKSEDDEAENASSEASLAGIVAGLGLAGALGFIVTLFYSSLWAMRTGLLSRFWGSLGMASGIALLLGPLVVVTLAWFAYFAFLLFGIVPGGRPPAWEAGEAVPWPTPGERAAAELDPSEDGEDDESGSEDGDGSGERRKRKRRG